MELLLKFAIPLVLVSTIYGQDNAGLELSLSGRVVKKEGENLVVICSLNSDTPGYESAKFKWFRHGTNNNLTEITKTSSSEHVYIRPAPNGLRLTINKLVDEDGGKYTCKATAGQEEYSDSFTLGVERTISFSQCAPNQKGLMGHEATLKCVASGLDLETGWEKDGLPINFTIPRYRIGGDGSLVIIGVNDGDAGTYVLDAYSSSTFESKRQEIILEIVVAPRITKPIVEGVAIEGTEHVMFCSADGRPLPEIQWYKDGVANALSDTDKIEVKTTDIDGIRQGSLKFYSVEKEDEGRYTCKAVGAKINEDDQVPLENSTSVELKVHTLPNVMDMAEQEATEGGGAELVCTVHGDPEPSVVWQKEGTDIQYSPGSIKDDITVSERSLVNPPGKETKLQFSRLKSTNAGVYKCVAKNAAGEHQNSVELKVLYVPHFNHQEMGPFYTWMGYTEGFIPCTGEGNPDPTFRWYRKDGATLTEVTSANQYYTITRAEYPDNENKVTSKLLVSFIGSNKVVFGDYVCVATNKVGESNQTLSIAEGLKPQPPLVSSHEVYATQIVFYISDPPVTGPPVTMYKITYNNNGEEIVLNQLKEDKIFTDDKSGNLKTTFIVRNLTPSTGYTFSIHATNLVGEGVAREKSLTTTAISVPKIVKILNTATSQTSNKINVIWEKPDNGGSAILEYHLTYIQVNVKPNNATLSSQTAYELDDRNPYVGEKRTHTGIKDTSFTISDGVQPGQYYMVKVKAINGQGAGDEGQMIIKTLDGMDGISTGAIIGILIAVFFILFIIVDVFCFFKSNCGVIMTIRETCGGGRGEEGYSAAKTDDVENLAKKDELTEEAKAAEENELAGGQVADEKKEPLLSEEQKVDTVDEVNALPEKEMEPEEKEEIKPETQPDTESKPEETPAQEETTEPATESQEEKPSELAQD